MLAKSLASTKKHPAPPSYMSPRQREIMFTRERRLLKVKVKRDADKLAAEGERKWRKAQEMVDKERRRELRQWRERGDVTQQRSSVHVEYHHSGRFEESSLLKAGVPRGIHELEGPIKHPSCWSCCLQEKEDARGCIATTVDPEAYNFASFCS